MGIYAWTLAVIGGGHINQHLTVYSLVHEPKTGAGQVREGAPAPAYKLYSWSRRLNATIDALILYAFETGTLTW